MVIIGSGKSRPTQACSNASASYTNSGCLFKNLSLELWWGGGERGAGRNSDGSVGSRPNRARKQDAQGSAGHSEDHALTRMCPHVHRCTHTHAHAKQWLNSASTSCGNVGLQAAPGPQMCAVWPPERENFLSCQHLKTGYFQTHSRNPRALGTAGAWPGGLLFHAARWAEAEWRPSPPGCPARVPGPGTGILRRART